MRPLTDGESWVRRELDALRAAGHGPGAIAAFLAASHNRAAATRRARPELVRQSRTWTGFGAATWLALALAGRQPFRRRLGSGLGWWAAVAVMLDWHLGMVETEDGRRRGLGPADALTLGRAWLVPVLADEIRPATVLAVAATDLLDGIAARATEPTRAGRDLDGLVDTCAAIAALGAARRSGRLGRPAATLELARLTAGPAYSASIYFGRAEAPDRALTGAARITTPVRVAGLLAAARGRTRLADVLVAAGSLTSLVALGHALLSERAGSGRAPQAWSRRRRRTQATT